jgi:hypothetical protein
MPNVSTTKLVGRHPSILYYMYVIYFPVCVMGAVLHAAEEDEYKWSWQTDTTLRDIAENPLLSLCVLCKTQCISLLGYVPCLC